MMGVKTAPTLFANILIFVSAQSTDFPLYAILSDAREVGFPTVSDVSVIATNFTAVQGSFQGRNGEDPSSFYNFSSVIRPLHYIATWASSNMAGVE